MEHGEQLKEAVLLSEISQIYAIIHTHFTWKSYVNLLVQMSFGLLGNGVIIDDICYSPFAPVNRVVCTVLVGC